jgi:deoxyribodipyrimidine photo-lyase
MRNVVWYRTNDLRVSDHAPLREATRGGEVIPLFVLDPDEHAYGRASASGPQTQFLLNSLRDLEQSLVARGSRLVVVLGTSVEAVPRLAREWSADRVFAHRSVEPRERDRERRIHAELGHQLELYPADTLLAPGTLRTRSGKPYSVFGQFARAFRAVGGIGRPLPPPKTVPPPGRDLRTGATRIPTCAELGIEPNASVLPGGERAARARLGRFLRHGLADYADRRDRLDLEGTSRLSADLKFGTLSVRQVWDAAEARLDRAAGAWAFLNELLWREFTHSTLWDRPELAVQPFHRAFIGFPWKADEAAWTAWVNGTTGYPVVDASARQLLAEGFIHNRARMVSASFLTKHLLIDYRRGEAHYMKHLTDGDLANNNAGWQWSAGTGCDAQPYFRVFNPVAQGNKFDPEGSYVRRWVPELGRLPARYIHSPWKAPDAVLRGAGVRLGDTYPLPIVDHHWARGRFLAMASAYLGRGSRA